MRPIELQTLKLLLLKFEKEVDEMPEKDVKEVMQICMRIPRGYEENSL